jgi:hypothetical protein
MNKDLYILSGELTTKDGFSLSFHQTRKTYVSGKGERSKDKRIKKIQNELDRVNDTFTRIIKTEAILQGIEARENRQAKKQAKNAKRYAKRKQERLSKRQSK